jgi:hypothetical protein
MNDQNTCRVIDFITHIGFHENVDTQRQKTYIWVKINNYIYIYTCIFLRLNLSEENFSKIFPWSTFSFLSSQLTKKELVIQDVKLLFWFFFIFIFYHIWAWTQGLYLEPLHQLFLFRYFWARVLQTIFLGWHQTMISASWVARIIGMSHQCLAIWLFNGKNFGIQYTLYLK